ncbi:MAG: OmpA family protein [Prolixibacteraceae bacterium]|jgi:outer membrane protein OmpA-like peptidoglycan-associated protein|nr:OmpA family protein [Prolixibacteraceae bacterium]
MKNILIISVLLVELLFSCSSYRSGINPNNKEELFEKGLEAYRSGGYHLAENYLEKAIQIDSFYVDAYLLMSDVAAELGDNDLRLFSLEKVLLLEPGKYKVAHKYVSDIYQQRGKFADATFHLTKYLENYNGSDTSAFKLQLENNEKSRYLVENKLTNVNIKAFNETINTENDEYWPFPSADDSTIYFTRLIKPEQSHPFERLFYSERNRDGWETAVQLSIGDVREVNEGTISMIANENLIFFTACGRSDGYGSCDIYFMIKKNKWVGAFNAGKNVNTAAWDAQPSVSANGDLLFWSSSREGGFGKQDIWFCTIQKNSKGVIEFGEPVNAGTGINTTKNDFSPFIHADNRTLYFASTGHYGMGNSDMFVSRFESNQWSRAKNLGYPINSINDDDGLVVSPSAHLALFSSNRSTSVKNSKDIYYFNLPNESKPNKMGYLKGFVYNRGTNEKINAKIELSKLNTKQKQIVESDIKNGYTTVIEAGHTYALNLSLPGFLLYSRHFDYNNPDTFNDAATENIYLEPIRLDATVILNNIFFEFDSYKINSKSETELMKVVEFMKQNSSVKIEISGHTDNVGSEQYNLQLSKKRAESIALYISEYINASRIKHVGYGAQNPVGDNETEAGRSKNRRSELKITGI